MSGPMFDRDGRHWEGHGEHVCSDPRHGGKGALLSTYTRRDERCHEGRVTVLLAVDMQPFSVNAFFSPAKARALSASLLLAADHADLVQAAVDAKGTKKAKAVAA